MDYCHLIFAAACQIETPSGVAAIFRTTPPPEGIGQLENDPVSGSNLTIVSGVTPGSLPGSRFIAWL